MGETKNYRRRLRNEVTGETKTQSIITGMDPFDLAPYMLRDGWVIVGEIEELDRADIDPRQLEQAWSAAASMHHGRRVTMKLVKDPPRPKVIARHKRTS